MIKDQVKDNLRKENKGSGGTKRLSLEDIQRDGNERFSLKDCKDCEPYFENQIEASLDIESLVGKLSSSQQEPLRLLIQGYTRKEIAEMLHRPEETVKKQIQRAKKLLRNLL